MTYEQHLADAAEKLRTKTGRKLRAQEMIMDSIGNVLGYWAEANEIDAQVMTESEQDEFRQILQQQADRVAKMFGYDNAWSN